MTDTAPILKNLYNISVNNKLKRRNANEIGEYNDTNSLINKSKKRKSSSDIKYIVSTLDKPAKKADEVVKPMDHLQTLLKSHGVSKPVISGSSLIQYFIDPTEEHFSSYKEDVIRAIRCNDVPKLKQFHNDGRSLQCCNKFGESLIHMACRRSLNNVVSYLLQIGVSVKVRDDFGRTPMHDAFWTAEPNYELVDLLLGVEPSLLFVSDKRGHTPLDYVRRSHWKNWKGFLSERVRIIIARLDEKDFNII